MNHRARGRGGRDHRASFSGSGHGGVAVEDLADVVEAGALSASRMFAALAESWQGFYDNLVRDHRAAPTREPIDYDRLADLVVAKLKASDKPKP